MSKEEFELTKKQIRCLQELGEGWNNVWEDISKELLSSTVTNKDKEASEVRTTGRLYSVAHSVARSCQNHYAGSQISEFDIDDFVSFVYERYHEEVLNKIRFIDYDYEKYGGDVFAYLCNPFIIRQMFWRYQRQNTLIKTPSTKPSTEPPIKRLEPCNIRDDKPVIGKDGKEESFIESNIADKSQSKPDYDEVNPLQVLSNEKWVLTISPTAKGTFFPKDIHAGLQLYPRIDYSDQNMLKLQEDVHKNVAKADKFNNEPQTKIEREHKTATERIDEMINTICDKLFDIKRQKVRSVNDTAEKNMNRKIAKYRLQEIYRPLDATQIADLFGVNRTSADQTIKRYYEFVTNILPLSDDAKEQFRPLFLQVFQNEKGENDD